MREFEEIQREGESKRMSGRETERVKRLDS